MSEQPEIKTLYDSLTPYDAEDKEFVHVLNKADGFRYLTVTVARATGMAGGPRMTHSKPMRLYPGLNEVPKSYWDRVEADAQRQRGTGGGVLADMLDRDFEVVRSLSKVAPAKVAEWLMASANIGLVAELRSDPKHGDAAARAFKAWHDPEANNETRRLRHFWAMATGSRKAA